MAANRVSPNPWGQSPLTLSLALGDSPPNLHDFADPEKPVLVKHWKVSGNPDIAQFHKGKVVIPCGHQGVLLQK